MSWLAPLIAGVSLSLQMIAGRAIGGVRPMNTGVARACELWRASQAAIAAARMQAYARGRGLSAGSIR